MPTLPATPFLLRRPHIFAQFPGLVAAESTRHGGVSPAPFATLNLGKSTADAPANVAENRRRFAAAAGFGVEALAWSHQVHGRQIRLVTEPGGAKGFDALVTRAPGVVLAVSVADCAPILIFDAENRAVAAVHAGWRGTAAQLVGQTLRFMAGAFGTRGAGCFAYVGACIGAADFEVGEEVAAQFDGAFKRFDPARDKFLIDLKKANAAQLSAFGIPGPQIEISPFCTVRDHADYFSHRREKGTTGRMLAVIGC